MFFVVIIIPLLELCLVLKLFLFLVPSGDRKISE